MSVPFLGAELADQSMFRKRPGPSLAPRPSLWLPLAVLGSRLPSLSLPQESYVPRTNFSKPSLANAPECQFVPAPADTVLLDGFISTSNFPIYVKIGGRWRMPERPHDEGFPHKAGRLRQNVEASLQTAAASTWREAMPARKLRDSRGRAAAVSRRAMICLRPWRGSVPLTHSLLRGNILPWSRRSLRRTGSPFRPKSGESSGPSPVEA
jgi:hypothetical protein